MAKQTAKIESASADAAAKSLASRKLLAEQLQRSFAPLSAEERLRRAIGGDAPGPIALVSSFGADSVVLLHMVAQIDRALPVLFLETHMLFPETIAYQKQLIERLGLSGLRVIRPDRAELAAEDPIDELHLSDVDACCDLRKTRPLERALSEFGSSISGRKRFQASTRADMPFVETDGPDRLKINPLADWTAEDLSVYRRKANLPPHPLVAQGYPSIGCAPCTSKVAESEDARAGRWRGSDKTECGIHIVNGRIVRGGASS